MDQTAHNPLVGLVHGALAVGLLLAAMLFTSDGDAQRANSPELPTSIEATQLGR